MIGILEMGYRRQFAMAGRYHIYGAAVPAKIVGLGGEVIKEVVFNEASECGLR